MLKSEIRGADYHARAREALMLAEASLLPQVRRRHEAAASVWLALTADEARRTQHARVAAARLPARAKAVPGDSSGENV